MANKTLLIIERSGVMKYTATEICDILEIAQATIWSWINEGIVSHHNNRKGEVVKLKAELVSGGKVGGKYYLVEANDLNDFLTALYKESYFYKWFRK